jgi:protoheme IX farnesyltransferase
MIAWAAVTGSVSWPAIILFLIIFFWTPPHFWALALYRNEDYQRAGVPMLPVTHGARRTKMEMLIYTLVLFPLSLMPYFVHIAGMVYLIGAVILSSLFVVCAVRVWFDTTHKTARQMFGFSLFYLTVLLILMLIEPTTKVFS